MSRSHLLSAVCLLLALACAAAAWACSRASVESPSEIPGVPRLQLDNPLIELGTVRARERLAIEVRVINTSTHPACVLTRSPVCGPGGCFIPGLLKPLVIAPSSTAIYPLGFEPYGSGPFEASLRIYVDDDGMRSLTVTIRGIIASEGE